jgi:transposase
MTPIIRTQKIKGVEYVYEDYPYWCKEAKQSRHNRVYIGKLGPDGELIPNKAYLSRQREIAEKEVTQSPIKPASRCYFGATHLLDEISTITGVKDDLKACFPDHYEILLSLAYYLVLESDSPMYRFPRWAHDHQHPGWHPYSSQRISELMRAISESGKLNFFIKQSQRRMEKEYLAYDTTSVSSWSEYIKAVRYGMNKDHDNLPQVNMALIFGEESSLPVYYRVLPGNINDVSTIRKLLRDINFLEIKKLKLVMDRGFFSTNNINALYREHHKFLISVKTNIGFVSGLVEEAKATIKHYSNYDINHDVYYLGSTEKWPYTHKDRHGKAVKEDRKIYVHIYYNGIRAEEEKTRFSRALAKTEAALRSKAELTKYQTSLKENYLIVKETPKRGITIQYKNEAIEKHMDNIGYFVLLSNDIKDSVAALEIYRKKDMVEKAFDNLKERLEMKRTSVHSDGTLAGKFFIQFLALIFVSYIHKHMRDNDLYRNYTMQSLLDSLDVIERFDYEGIKSHCSEITEKQKKIYACFGVTPPTIS